MTEKKRRQGQPGTKTVKTICPKCEQEYLKTAFGTDKKQFKRIGQYCPNPSCDYILKDFVELEDTENIDEVEEDTKGTDKANKIKKLTAEFVKKHEELSRLAEQINELETE
jgi:hypothetical protein